MDKATMKHLKSGDRVVRINTNYTFYNYLDDTTAFEEEWLTIEDSNLAFFTCHNWQGKRKLVLVDDMLNYSTTTLSAYENALERLKKQDVGITKKIILCESMIADLKKENEDEET